VQRIKAELSLDKNPAEVLYGNDYGDLSRADLRTFWGPSSWINDEAVGTVLWALLQCSLREAAKAAGTTTVWKSGDPPRPAPSSHFFNSHAFSKLVGMAPATMPDPSGKKDAKGCIIRIPNPDAGRWDFPEGNPTVIERSSP